jgi:hypothetical protein
VFNWTGFWAYPESTPPPPESMGQRVTFPRLKHTRLQPRE